MSQGLSTIQTSLDAESGLFSPSAVMAMSYFFPFSQGEIGHAATPMNAKIALAMSDRRIHCGERQGDMRLFCFDTVVNH
jgi:hypothetical protein